MVAVGAASKAGPSQPRHTSTLYGTSEQVTNEATATIAQLDDAGLLWRVSAAGREGCGHIADALLQGLPLTAQSAWRDAIRAAVERGVQTEERRARLSVIAGHGPWYHVSPTANRQSIRHYGLDWTRMELPGWANSRKPERPGIFLCNSVEGARRLTRSQPYREFDLWSAELCGTWLESSPWAEAPAHMISPVAIAAGAIRLIGKGDEAE